MIAGGIFIFYFNIKFGYDLKKLYSILKERNKTNKKTFLYKNVFHNVQAPVYQMHKISHIYSQRVHYLDKLIAQKVFVILNCTFLILFDVYALPTN